MVTTYFKIFCGFYPKTSDIFLIKQKNENIFAKIVMTIQINAIILTQIESAICNLRPLTIFYRELFEVVLCCNFPRL